MFSLQPNVYAKKVGERRLCGVLFDGANLRGSTTSTALHMHHKQQPNLNTPGE
jgi:hypothetical protein